MKRKTSNLKFVLIVYKNGIPVKGGKHISGNPEYIKKKIGEYKR